MLSNAAVEKVSKALTTNSQTTDVLGVYGFDRQAGNPLCIIKPTPVDCTHGGRGFSLTTALNLDVPSSPPTGGYSDIQMTISCVASKSCTCGATSFNYKIQSVIPMALDPRSNMATCGKCVLITPDVVPMRYGGGWGPSPFKASVCPSKMYDAVITNLTCVANTQPSFTALTEDVGGTLVSPPTGCGGMPQVNVNSIPVVDNSTGSVTCTGSVDSYDSNCWTGSGQLTLRLSGGGNCVVQPGKKTIDATPN